jgi:HlyD family secretion protein
LSDRFQLTEVRRASLAPTLKATGQIESGKRTVIECQLERMAVGVAGQRLTAGGASVVLSVIPEGALVKRGDVLAVLDSSDYEELLRVQRITVERAKADQLQARLDHEIAKLALEEFREGTMKETIEGFQGRINLVRSDLERTADRADWSRRMKAKGYVSEAVVSGDAYRLAQMELLVKQEESAFELFKKFTAPKTIRELEGAVISAESILSYQNMRVHRHVGRLEKLEKQVELCTIRAPHDGFLVYANDRRREITIEEGMPVRQWQKLFYLPDLQDMEVVAQLHESIVDQVRPGMRAQVEVESMPDHTIPGRVRSIAPLATTTWESDARYFQSIVKLENSPRGLLPGMTAELEIDMPRRENVLAVPSEAVTYADGQEICFVFHEEGLERREVKLGLTTRDLTEITEGLTEGEQVVLHPVVEEDDLVSLAVPAQAGAANAGSSPDYSTGAIAASR